MNALPLIIGIAAAAGAYLLTIGIIAARAADATALARERLSRQEIGLGQSAVALQLEKPFLQRLFGPARRWLDRKTMRRPPEAQAANFRRQLDSGGNPLGLDPAGLQTLRIAAAAGLGAIGTAVGLFIGPPFAFGLSLVIGVALGFYLPVFWLDQLVRDRRGVPEAALPNSLVAPPGSREAGLGLLPALAPVGRPPAHPPPPSGGRALREVPGGRPRPHAR